MIRKFPKSFALSNNIRLIFDFPIDESLGDLLSKILEKDPAKRITIPEIKAHRWVTKNGLYPLKEVCGEIQVTDQDIETAIHRVTSFSNLKTFNLNSGGPKRTRVVPLSESPSQQKLVHSVSRPNAIRRVSYTFSFQFLIHRYLTSYYQC